jgi:uncharacterized protein YhaN
MGCEEFLHNSLAAAVASSRRYEERWHRLRADRAEEQEKLFCRIAELEDRLQSFESSPAKAGGELGRLLESHWYDHTLGPEEILAAAALDRLEELKVIAERVAKLKLLHPEIAAECGLMDMG